MRFLNPFRKMTVRARTEITDTAPADTLAAAGGLVAALLDLLQKASGARSSGARLASVSAGSRLSYFRASPNLLDSQREPGRMVATWTFSEPLTQFSQTRYFPNLILQKVDRARISPAWQTGHCLAQAFVRSSWCTRAAARTLLRVRAPTQVPLAQPPAPLLPGPAQARAPQRAPLLQSDGRAAHSPEALTPQAGAQERPMPATVARPRQRSTAEQCMRWNVTVTPKTAISVLSPASASAVRRQTSLPAGPAPIAAPPLPTARMLRPAPKRRPVVSRSPLPAIACSSAATKTNPSPAPTAWRATCRRSHRSGIAFGNEQVTRPRWRASLREMGRSRPASQPALGRVPALEHRRTGSADSRSAATRPCVAAMASLVYGLVSNRSAL